MLALFDSINISQITRAHTDIHGDYFVSPGFRFCYINSGKCDWEIANNIYNVTAGDVLVLNNIDSRRILNVFEMVKITIIDIKPQLLFSCNFIPIFKGSRCFSPVIHNPSEKVDYLFKTLKKEKDEVSLALALPIIFYIKEHYEGLGFFSDEIKINKHIQTALEYIDKNFCGDITLAEVAKTIPMSRTGFSKFFLKHLKIGFSEYINRKRIQKSIDLLKNTNDTVLNIAMQCGFKNSTNFYKTFNRIAGATPKLYRSNHNQHALL